MGSCLAAAVRILETSVDPLTADEIIAQTPKPTMVATEMLRPGTTRGTMYLLS